MTADLDLLLAEGRAAAEKLREVMRPEYRAKALGTMPTRQCQWCFNLYSGFALDLPQRERLRSVTMTTGGAATEEPDICAACYDSVVEAAPRRNNDSSFDIGASNCGHPNLLLARSV